MEYLGHSVHSVSISLPYETIFGMGSSFGGVGVDYGWLNVSVQVHCATVSSAAQMNGHVSASGRILVHSSPQPSTANEPDRLQQTGYIVSPTDELC